MWRIALWDSRLGLLKGGFCALLYLLICSLYGIYFFGNMCSIMLSCLYPTHVVVVATSGRYTEGAWWSFLAECSVDMQENTRIYFRYIQKVMLTHEISSLKTTAARLKFKGIDGGLHKRWSMWFNSKQRAEPYQVLQFFISYRLFDMYVKNRRCMAVVSSWRELLG